MVALIAVLIAQSAHGPLVGLWLPVILGAGTLAGVVLAALRVRPDGESRLYADAMRMVTELKEQLGAATAKIDLLQTQLESERDERRAAEREVVKLYARIESLEAKLGGRRQDD